MPLSENQLAARDLTDFYSSPSRRRWTGWLRLRSLGWRRALGLGSLVLAILLSATTFFGCGRSRHAPGPVASVHEAWGVNCQACHGPEASDPGQRAAVHHVSDETCRACHPVGPHQQSTRGIEGSCAGCHREHRGKHALLIRPPDSNCTRCHESLSARVPGGNPSSLFADAVHRFDSPPAHPAFQPTRGISPAGAVWSLGMPAALPGPGPILAALALTAGREFDPVRLRFNHALHLRPGLLPVRDGQPFGQPLTYAQLPDEDRPRYQGGRGIREEVRLQCAACHVFIEGDASRSGAYPLPIHYETHCRACHPLTFDERLPSDPQQPRLRVPHRLQPGDVRKFLDGAYLAEYLGGNRKLLERPVPRRPRPGQSLDRGEGPLLARLRDDVEKAERYLYQGEATCIKCHPSQPPPGKQAPAHIPPPGIPEVWLRHARFSHKAHRALDCRACHPDAPSSTQASDLLLPGIDNCLQCHTSPRRADEHGFGGVRSDCADCHGYHRPGLRSPAGEEPPPRFTIEQLKRWPAKGPRF